MFTNSPQGANSSGINIRDISSPLRVMSLSSPVSSLGALIHSPQLAQKVRSFTVRLHWCQFYVTDQYWMPSLPLTLVLHWLFSLNYFDKLITCTCIWMCYFVYYFIHFPCQNNLSKLICLLFRNCFFYQCYVIIILYLKLHIICRFTVW